MSHAYAQRKKLGARTKQPEMRDGPPLHLPEMVKSAHCYAEDRHHACSGVVQVWGHGRWLCRCECHRSER